MKTVCCSHFFWYYCLGCISHIYMIKLLDDQKKHLLNINSMCWIPLDLLSRTRTLIRKRKIKSDDIQDQFLNFLSRGVILARPHFYSEYQNKQLSLKSLACEQNWQHLIHLCLCLPVLFLPLWLSAPPPGPSFCMSLCVSRCLCQFVVSITTGPSFWPLWCGFLLRWPGLIFGFLPISGTGLDNKYNYWFYFEGQDLPWFLCATACVLHAGIFEQQCDNHPSKISHHILFY